MTEKTLICNGCKKEREEQNKLPLQLVEISSEIFGNPDVKDTVFVPSRPLFKDHSIPLYLCKYCDAQELAAVESILSQAE